MKSKFAACDFNVEKLQMNINGVGSIHVGVVSDFSSVKNENLTQKHSYRSQIFVTLLIFMKSN